jgi:DNA-binding CsgD family transcriptional regulator
VFRLLGLLGGLSIATDMGTGAPLEESLRRCVLAARLARSAGCSDDDVRDVIYTSLLQHLGCTAYSHELAGIFGDDIASTRFAFLMDAADSRDVLRTFVPGVAQATGRSKSRLLAAMLTSGRQVDANGPVATCEVARNAALRLGLPEQVSDGLAHVTSMWNGTGYPAVEDLDVPLATRIMHVSSVAVMFCLHGGKEVAVDQVVRRSGTFLDPDLVAVFSADLLDDIADLDAYQQVLDAEPDPVRMVDDAGVERVANTFGDLVDLKSPWLHGHSAAVADLAADAATALGFEPAAVQSVRIAGHLHDLGRIGVSSRIWDKPGPLSATERAQVELHAYHTEQILSRVPALADIARWASQHHERCDGSGYHRGVTATQLTMPSRVLAAADAYRCVVEERPHRPAVLPDQAAARLNAQATAGRLDGDAVAAVLAAAGQHRGVRRARPGSLTERQVEVLRLLAAGLSNRDIAKRLVISRRTAEHHVQDVYAKIGASTRAGAALFAMEHGLLHDQKSG